QSSSLSINRGIANSRDYRAGSLNSAGLLFFINASGSKRQQPLGKASDDPARPTVRSARCRRIFDMRALVLATSVAGLVMPGTVEAATPGNATYLKPCCPQFNFSRIEKLGLTGPERRH
ncbi:hypothetical protein, partial [Azotobacter chroococcum]|uniref:hypothetical protein n=1 Tax=Azotobacter chroococcum TaxID=353 RepID=UPI001B8AC915